MKKSKRKVRRFMVTVEEVEVDPLDVVHQEPPAWNTRKRPAPAGVWFESEEKRRSRTLAEFIKRGKARANEGL